MLETENKQLRSLLHLPEADRPKIGSGPTGRGKSLKDGGVPMSERVRARKEARARERALRGIGTDVLDLSDDDDDLESPDPMTGTPSSSAGVAINANAHANTNANTGITPNNNNNNNNNGVNAAAAAAVAAAAAAAVTTTNNSQTASAIPLFSNPGDLPAPYSFNLPTPFQLPISPDATFDYNAANLTNPAAQFHLFNMFEPTNTVPTPTTDNQTTAVNTLQPPTSMSAVDGSKQSPMSPNTSAAAAAAQAAAGSPPNQPDLLTRLKACCHLSDSHVVNDPGLLIFATRLCQSYACPFGGAHPESGPCDDPDHILLEDAWRVLKATLDPTGEADGENRINTGRMAAELVGRLAAARGNGSFISCRFKEGMTIRRELLAPFVASFGGKLD